MNRISLRFIAILSLLAFAFPATSPVIATSIATQDTNSPNLPTPDHQTQSNRSETNEWAIECVDCPKKFDNLTDRSMRLDSDGHPHIAYGEDHLYYAWNDGATWQYTTVDNTPYVGQHAALALDKTQYPYISYQDSQNYDLKFAYRDSDDWHLETIDSVGETGFYTSIALDANNIAHISYFDQTNGDLKYAYQNKDGWQIQTVDSIGVVGWYTSLALNQMGIPCISYFSKSEYSLKYACKQADGWHTQIILSDDEDGYYTSLALDPGGKAHISHARCYEECSGKSCWRTCDLKYTYQDSDGWQSQILDQEGTTNATSLVVDGLGYPYISYSSSNVLKIAYQNSAGWQSETVNSEQDDVVSTSLSLDGEGHPGLSYVVYDCSYDLSELKYTSSESDNWNIQTVEWERYIGWSSLALGRDGYPQISFRDYKSSAPTELKYAQHEEAGWDIQTIDRMEYGGFGISIALDQLDSPHIVYYTIGTNEELRFATLDEHGWDIQTAFIHESIGSPSLALDLAGSPHISLSSNGIKYLYQDQDNWQIEAIDTVGNDSAITLDQDGHPHVSYGTYSDLRYAYHDGNKWSVQAVEIDNLLHIGTSITLGDDGHVHISYLRRNFEDSLDSLGYASWDGSEWQILTLDDNAEVSRSTKVVVDSQGYAHISYTSKDIYGYSHPMYAYQDTTGWHFHRLDSEQPGYSESLALDPNDRPHITFVDAEGIKYAHQLNPFHELTYAPMELLGYGLPGDTLHYTLLVTNTGQISDTVKLTFSGNTWHTSAPTLVGPLLVAEQAALNIQVTIPPTATLGSSDTATITLTSQNDPSITGTATLTTYAAITTYLPLVER